jgi:hypothetical protein
MSFTRIVSSNGYDGRQSLNGSVLIVDNQLLYRRSYPQQRNQFELIQRFDPYALQFQYLNQVYVSKLLECEH